MSHNSIQANAPKPKTHSIKALFIIVDYGKADKIIALTERQGIHCSFVSQGEGTANSEIIDLLGLGDSKKDIILAVSCAEKIESVMKKIYQVYHGMGIAFTVGLNSVGGKNIKSLLEGAINNE